MLKAKTLPPSSIIGILGGGQLGRMLAIAAAEMGYKTHIYCPEENSPASEVSCFNTVGKYDDITALTNFAGQVDVVTYEFENIPAKPVEEIAKLVSIFPSPKILAISQDRILEKQAVNDMGIATAPFAVVNSSDDLQKAVEKIGFPCVLKTSRMGYDGKGQNTLRSKSDVESSSSRILESSHILEGFVDFVMEISVIVARDINKNIRCYCPVQNIHKNHILAETIVPAPISSTLASEAESVATKIATELDLVGLMAIEMFVTRDNKILVNELAPRPHNSGHWTIDASVTSQFEQTVRAVCGLPLGNPELLCDARMINLIGDDINDWQIYLAQDNAKLHLYGKKEVKTGRKMGHVTIVNSAK